MCLQALAESPTILLDSGKCAGYEWAVLKNDHIGIRCGYVRIPVGHPWHEKDYNDIDASVHGGLTYADHGYGETADDWWIGFDAGHAYDGWDPELLGPEASDAIRQIANMKDIGAGTIKDTAYMARECRSLCEQAAKATNGP